MSTFDPSGSAARGMAMRLDDFRESSNVEDRRGQRGGGGGLGGLPIGRGGLGIGGVLVVLAISYFTGINPAVLLNGYEQVSGGGQEQSEPVQRGQQGAPADDTGHFVSRVLGSTEDTWTAVFRDQLKAQYRAPELVLFSGVTRSGCGTAQRAMGPFYCPEDGKVYLDTAFFQEMQGRLRACPSGPSACSFSQAYVIAHEIGHHVQDMMGTLGRANQARSQTSEARSNAISVRIELQADCYAGVWANQAQSQREFLEPGDVEAALQTASAIGDDTLQRRSQGEVVPDSFTHGSAAQRQRWFETGFRSGQVRACDTFASNAD